MPIELDASVHPELVPLSWLIGSWEGAGVVGYPGMENRQFGQRVDFTVPKGGNYLQYSAQSWLLDGEGQLEDTLALETGIWQLVRKRGEADPGPGMIPPSGPGEYRTAEQIETLRNDEGKFEVEVSLVHPHGVLELYAGTVDAAQIHLATDVVARTTTAKEYKASTRMYGLVKGDLLWAWDMAALGHSLASHASAQLKKVA
ncbi:FABP family protein [Sediminivirga luteola]|uniref:Peroxynitrite isomerase n=1 Tax=Sediminivirga luteola TaxID=1774748 RepID=A0A8J2XKI4_9MICO|nr:FABP family protein [Sediminivirga luteola]MCI2267173.1 FABP family protein [Sediminivirga luteola]GGA13895.1 hypothetical protein GCM10011333_16010 [Sediminivirga luteola]